MVKDSKYVDALGKPLKITVSLNLKPNRLDTNKTNQKELRLK
jgi:hypothetical protein